MILIRSRAELAAHLLARRALLTAQANAERSADRFNYAQGCADTCKEVLDLIRLWEEHDDARATDG